MNKRLSAAGALILLANLSPAAIADQQPPSAVISALRAIHSPAGSSVLQRMKNCRITFADGSWIERAVQDFPSLGAFAGDIILEAYINVPPMPGTGSPLAYSNLVARWLIRQGKALPASGWAKNLQLEPYPMPSFPWLHC